MEKSQRHHLVHHNASSSISTKSRHTLKREKITQHIQAIIDADKRKQINLSHPQKEAIPFSSKTIFNANNLLDLKLERPECTVEKNRKITDYFHIRKSTRKCRSDLEREKREQIECSIRLQLESGLEVKRVVTKGRGVFATSSFARGQFVCEYAGEILSYSQALQREAKYGQNPSIGCYMYFFEHKSKSYCVDATAETKRIGRLLNHSKLDGNCHTKVFETNDSRPCLILLASRDIEQGEELTFDYGDRNKRSLKSHPWLAE
jgi:histone-lysine N-methyltransferase SETD8